MKTVDESSKNASKIPNRIDGRIGGRKSKKLQHLESDLPKKRGDKNARPGNFYHLTMRAGGGEEKTFSRLGEKTFSRRVKKKSRKTKTKKGKNKIRRFC